MYWISQLEKLKREQRSQFYEERPFLRLPLPMCPPLEDVQFPIEFDEIVPRGVVIFEINPTEENSN
jgi:hypothetical protein